MATKTKTPRSTAPDSTPHHSLEDGPLVDAKEIGRLMGRHPAVIRRYAREGKLPAVRFNDRLLFWRGALLRQLARKEVVANVEG